MRKLVAMILMVLFLLSVLGIVIISVGLIEAWYGASVATALELNPWIVYFSLWSPLAFFLVSLYLFIMKRYYKDCVPWWNSRSKVLTLELELTSDQPWELTDGDFDLVLTKVAEEIAQAAYTGAVRGSSCSGMEYLKKVTVRKGKITGAAVLPGRHYQPYPGK